MAATMSPNPARKRTVKNALLTAGRCARTAIKRVISCFDRWCSWVGQRSSDRLRKGLLVGGRRERDARACV